MSARELSMRLVERFRRDGVFSGSIWLDKGELILPIGPDFIDAVERVYDDALALGHTMDSAADRIASMSATPLPLRATYTPVDPAAFFAMLNRSDDDWREITEDAVNAERKANRARERALKRSRRNTKSPKKKGKRR
ncbi:hypothetical protein [Collinsella sp. TF10-11AT]|uniref:hypothetical protein n=1 Tax=Collinsella sp. TF10-11AT TaxID=2292335 RepID=UPI0011C0CA1E|nr:hypothetical protein [Collinsella sp. TF10-11AT]